MQIFPLGKTFKFKNLVRIMNSFHVKTKHCDHSVSHIRSTFTQPTSKQHYYILALIILPSRKLASNVLAPSDACKLTASLWEEAKLKLKF